MKKNALYTFCVEIQFGANSMMDAREYIERLMSKEKSQIGYFKRTRI